MKLLLY